MSRKGLSPARLEAFSDGVIAVIITILVLELKVPEPNGMAGLRVVLPAVFLYLLTFVQIGIYWVNHHYLVDEVETVSHGILWTNLMFLFCLSLFPVATEWIGIKGLVVVHHGTLCRGQYPPWAWIYGAVESDSFQEHRMAHASWGKQIASVVLYLTAIPMAYFRPAASLALISIVSVLWLLPPRSESHPE